jgi:hypothetical protein
MPKNILFLFGFLLLLGWGCENKSMNKPVLHQSSTFTVYADSVTQGSHSAVAVSDSEIVSNYQSPPNQTYSRVVAFKFSINGRDNEQAVGVDHRLVLYPKEGKVLAPIIPFGQPDTGRVQEPENDFLEPNTQLTLRLDLRQVLDAFEEEGFYTTYNGEKIKKKDFKGVYVAGSAHPLTWDFSRLPELKHLELTDADKDGIYEVTLTMNPYQKQTAITNRWKLEKDLSGLPRYHSPQKLVDALYNLSLEQMLLDIRPDNTFMAGAEWEGVWTRDISYSILLSLAAIRPDIARNSLMRKVKGADGRPGKIIIQDTGTGGAWPVSTDRTTWALAAWEVYKVTGDREWLQEAYAIIKQSAEDDLKTIVDPKTGLMRGESSFLDWREQTYPVWMEPVDIYSSEALGTNAVHYQTYRILTEMGSLLGEPTEKYRKVAQTIQKGINQHLWMEEKGYYGQYLYGRQQLALSPRAEALGEALCVLFDVADSERQSRVIRNTPVLDFGIPCIYPQIPGIPPYHNEAIWPFVQAYWTWAAAKKGHSAAVSQSLGALYRQAALFINNKENLVARTGDFRGTQINSDRQLWSVAGNLAMVYRVLFGMDFRPDELVLQPVVPAAYAGTRTLTDFRYRNATLSIELEGYGNRIQSVTLDGKAIDRAAIPANLQGNHHLKIRLADNNPGEQALNLVENYVSPSTPCVLKTKASLLWQPVNGAVKYLVYKNGQLDTTTVTTSYQVKKQRNYAAYQVVAVDEKGYESFSSAPVVFVNDALVKIGQAEKIEKFSRRSRSRSRQKTPVKSYLELSKTQHTEVNIQVTVVLPGTYLADFRYANGNGPINTENKCAIRTLLLNGKTVGAVVFPQRGEGQWSWGYTNTYALRLERGEQTLTLRFEPSNENMNGEVNQALLDHLRLIKVQ